MSAVILAPLLLAVSASDRAGATQRTPATICIRAIELHGVDPSASGQLRVAVEMELARHEVRVAYVEGAKRSSRNPCRHRVARSRKGVLFLDLKTARVGPLVQFSVAFYRPGNRAPTLQFSWSAEAGAVLASEDLPETLAQGALLAHELAGSEPRGHAPDPAPPASTPPPGESAVVDRPARHTAAEESSTPVDATATAEPTEVEAVEESSPLFWPAVATLGAGAVGVSVGAVFGVKALVHKNRAADTNAPGSQLELPRMEESQRVANWSYLVGGVLAATGLAMLLLSPSEAPATVAVQTAENRCVMALTGTF